MGQLVRDNDGALVYAAAATRWVATGRAVFGFIPFGAMVGRW